MGGLSRREVLGSGLALAGAGCLSGCLTGGRLRRYRVVNDPAPTGFGATVSAAALAGPTTNAPLRLRITFTAATDRPTAFALRPDRPFPFGEATATGVRREGDTGATGAAGTNRLVLVPTGDRSTFADRCWRLQSAAGATPTGGDAVVHLDPDESVTAERTVVNHPDNPTCYPFGRYAFEETFWAGPDAENRADTDAVRWGFTLEVNDMMAR